MLNYVVASSVPQLDQTDLSYGTTLMGYEGYNTPTPETDIAMVTLNGNQSGISGLRFFYPENNPAHGVKPYPFTIRGNGSNLYAINLGLTGVYNAIDFGTNLCDKHLVRNVSGVIYNNGIVVSANTIGWIENCLTNPSKVARCNYGVPGWMSGGDAPYLIDSSQMNEKLVIIKNSFNEQMMNVFSYAANTGLWVQSGSVNCFNFGSDNLGLYTIRADCGNVVTNIMNVMRYNGTTSSGNVTLYNEMYLSADLNPPLSSPSITSEPPDTEKVGRLFSYNITTSGSPMPGISVTGNPTWLNLNGSILSGTPPSVGTFGPITVTASNSASCPNATQTFSIVVDTNILTSGDGATFVSQSSIPDTMITGQTFTVNITMLNTGTTTWTNPDQFKLGSMNPRDNTTWGTNRIYLATGDSIAPNADKTFTFTITAPSIPGTYNFQWEMVQDGVQWFGDTTSNIVIVVTQALPQNSAIFVTQSFLPDTMILGQTDTVSITMQNDGNTVWTADAGYKLGSQNPQDNTTWGISRIYLATGDSIIPNADKTFSFTITAPSTPGTYNFQWKMLQEGVQWFGGMTPNIAITVVQALPQNAAIFVSQSNIPDSMITGQTDTVSVTMQNIGNTAWTATSGYKLGSQNPQDNTIWGTDSINLASGDSIIPNDTKTFTFTITAPSTPGSYNFQWEMVQEDVQWFGDLTPNVVIVVSSNPVLGTNIATFVNQINVYPDPSNGTFTIEGAGGRLLKIYSMDGQELFFKPISSNLEEINSGLSTGSYILKIFDLEGATKSIIILVL